MPFLKGKLFSNPFTLFLTLFLLFAAPLRAEDSPVHIVANTSVQHASLSSHQLRRIFSMRQSTWPDGLAIKVFVLDSKDPAHQQLCKQVLGVFPYQMDRLWNKLAFSGLGEIPTKVESEAEMIQKIKNTPGAIGYIASEPKDSELKYVQVGEE